MPSGWRPGNGFVRGWLAADGTLTDAGHASRDAVETRTDELALVCWDRLGEDTCTRLRELVRPFSHAIVEQGFPFATVWDED